MRNDVIEKVKNATFRELTSMIELLEEMLNINSYTYIEENVNKINDIMERELKSIGFSTERMLNPNGGDCVIGRYNVSEKPILLIGHTDMAIPLRDIDKKIVHNGRINCPGAIDMKSGLVNLILSMKILKKLEFLPNNISIVLSGDEEQGSSFAKDYIYSEASKSRLTISLEAARKNGEIVDKRKGGAYFNLVVHGRSAHSGTEFSKGISAIEEMAHKIIQIHQLTDLSKGVTSNIGYINGGNTLGNAIADQCEAKIDIKFMSLEEGEKTVNKLKEICKTSFIEGTTIDLNGDIKFPPMTKTSDTEILVTRIKQLGELLGLNIDSVASGEADIGHAALTGISCIDGLGPVGGGHHTYEEYVEVNTMPERCALLGLCIIDL